MLKTGQGGSCGDMDQGTFDVRPVSLATERAFQDLFSGKGCPGFCWCTPYRFQDAQEMGRDEKRDAMLGLIRKEVPIGVLGFDGDEPVGWCSVAPRSTYKKLERSRTMPVVDEEAWSILCVFVRPSHRGQGLAHSLVEGAVEYAKGKRARIVEAYPWDTAGLSGTGPAKHWGHSKVYAACGFKADEGRRWVRRINGSRA